MCRTLVFALVLVSLACGVIAQGDERSQRTSASLTVMPVTEKRQYKVGEQWDYTFTATVAAPKDEPLTIRAWTRFFAEYEVVPEVHGPLADSRLSDVLATGGQIWRDGVPVVLWNAPAPKVFSQCSRTVVAAGKSTTTTFRHNFGAGLKPGRFHQKLWFAVVVEPSPQRYMLLFSREPTDVEFVVEGEPIDFDTYFEQRNEWDKTRNFKFHTELAPRANGEQSPK
jgi:hypothetical protein